MENTNDKIAEVRTLLDNRSLFMHVLRLKQDEYRGRPLRIENQWKRFKPKHDGQD
jgi:hypothetical protein